MECFKGVILLFAFFVLFVFLSFTLYKNELKLTFFENDFFEAKVISKISEQIEKSHSPFVHYGGRSPDEVRISYEYEAYEIYLSYYAGDIKKYGYLNVFFKRSYDELKAGDVILVAKDIKGNLKSRNLLSKNVIISYVLVFSCIMFLLFLSISFIRCFLRNNN